MSSVVLSGDSSGQVSLTVPSAAGTNTATLPAATGTVMVSGNMPAFSAYMSTNPVINHNTSSKLPFNTEQFDTNNCFDSTTNYRFTPTVAGYYQVNAVVQCGGAAGRQYDNAIQIYKNGSNIQYYEISAAMGTGQQQTYSTSTLVYMNGTDYLELYFYVYDYTASSSATVYGSNSRFQASMVRSA